MLMGDPGIRGPKHTPLAIVSGPVWESSIRHMHTQVVRCWE